MAQIPNRSQEGNLGQGMKCLYYTARGHVMFITHKEHVGPAEKKMYLPIQMWNY